MREESRLKRLWSLGNEKRGNHKGGKTDRKGSKTKTIMHSKEKTGKYPGNNYTKY